MQLEGSTIDLMKQGQPGDADHDRLAGRQQLKKGEALGIDPTLMSMAAGSQPGERADAPRHPCQVRGRNLIDRIWTDRPEPSLAPLEVHPTRFAGETVATKLKRVRAAMAEVGAKAHVIAALDAVAWLLNIRSADILYTPVAVAYVVVTGKGCTLYVDARKVTGPVLEHLAKLARHQGLPGDRPDLRALARRSPAVWLDPATTNRWVATRCAAATSTRRRRRSRP